MMPKPTPEQVERAIADARELRRVYEAGQAGIPLDEYELNDIFLESDVIDQEPEPVTKKPPGEVPRYVIEAAIEYRAERKKRGGLR
jgi:hypothetical protein